MKIRMLPVCLFVAFVSMALAQDAPKLNQPPKILVITREFVKPGHTGAVHEKTQGAFVQAFTGQNRPTHFSKGLYQVSPWRARYRAREAVSRRRRHQQDFPRPVSI